MHQYISKIKQWLNAENQPDYQKSYSQCGEDLIVNFLFEILDIKHPTYVDIGAHHPKRLNNTYFFYKKGCRGICVEPDPVLFKKFNAQRKNDVNLNVGIAAQTTQSATFYVMTAKTLSTFSETEAENYTKSNSYGKQKIEKKIQIPLLGINDLFQKYSGSKVNFLSLDVEGLDKELIEALDFDKYAPDIICIETVRCIDNRTMKKDLELVHFLQNKGYMVYAETGINSILINKSIWSKKYDEII